MDPAIWAQSLESVPDVLVLVSADGVVVARNMAAGQFFETGDHLAAATSHTAAEVTEVVTRCARSSIPIPLPMQLAPVDDDRQWSVTGARVSGWTGEHSWLVLVRGVLNAPFVDPFPDLDVGVDQLSQEVSRRHEAEDALRTSEERFRLAFDFAMTPMVLGSLAHGEVGRILRVNTAMCELLGRRSDELVGTLVSDHTHPEDREITSDALADLSSRQINTWQGEKRYLRADGEVIDAVVRKSRAQHQANGPAYIVTQIDDVTASRAAERRLVQLALHDDLTGLANRTLLLDRLSGALDRRQRTGRGLSLLFLDLDDFKNVNDSLGHPVGDALLSTVAARLTDSVRASDTVARLGGDEFAVLCDGIDDADDISCFADRILAAVSAPVQLDDRRIVPSASIGVVTVQAVGEVRPDEVLRDADLAMYQAKRGGKNRFASFDVDLRTSSMDRMDIETGLRSALAADELHVAYQPVVDLRDGQRITGAEALLRWSHPTRGELLPGDFLVVAEETGMIEDIGAWILKQAASDAVSWHLATGAQQDRLTPPPTIAVNVAVSQIGGVALRRAIDSALEDSLIEPSHIQLEITEHQFMAASAATINELVALRELGLLLSLDDFGTGYSSLGYLKHFPFDIVKLDRSFVAGVTTDAGDRAIITAILGLASALGLQTVAEGVEEAEQAEVLTELGCQFGQGWHFGRPEPLAALVERTAPQDAPASASAPAPGSAEHDRTQCSDAGSVGGLQLDAGGAGRP